MKKKPEKFNVSLSCKIRSKRNVVIRTICSYPIKWPLESVSTQTVQTWFYKFESYFQVYNMNYINIQRKSSKLSIEFENYLTLSRTVHIRRKVSAKFLFHCHLILSRAYIKKLFSELPPPPTEPCIQRFEYLTSRKMETKKFKRRWMESVMNKLFEQ